MLALSTERLCDLRRTGAVAGITLAGVGAVVPGPVKDAQEPFGWGQTTSQTVDTHQPEAGDRQRDVKVTTVADTTVADGSVSVEVEGCDPFEIDIESVSPELAQAVRCVMKLEGLPEAMADEQRRKAEAVLIAEAMARTHRVPVAKRDDVYTRAWSTADPGPSEPVASDVIRITSDVIRAFGDLQADGDLSVGKPAHGGDVRADLSPR
jgi:hypothetical protein